MFSNFKISILTLAELEKKTLLAKFNNFAGLTEEPFLRLLG